jgi:hypothetical protein
VVFRIPESSALGRQAEKAQTSSAMAYTGKALTTLEWYLIAEVS